MLKSSPKLMQALIERSQRQRAKMQPIKELLDAYDGKMWHLITAKLKQMKKIYEDATGGYENLKSLSEAEIKMLSFGKWIIQRIIDQPEDAKKVLQAMKFEHDKTQAAIRARRQK